MLRVIWTSHLAPAGHKTVKVKNGRMQNGFDVFSIRSLSGFGWRLFNAFRAREQNALQRDLVFEGKEYVMPR